MAEISPPCDAVRDVAGRRSIKHPQSVKLTPADAFDLIRWLARSQSDPRKAVAELVQNAIDANAKAITIERRRRGRRTALIVRDDGDGIRPEEPREAALRYVATHIGRSHKRNLSAAERHAQIVAGQYGIGLLGFWSIGHRMEIRSRVSGGETWLLRLVEDEPRAEVVPGPPVIDASATFTEVVVSELHAAALRPLTVRRLAEYLGAELRGPILASGVAIEVRELDARGQLSERAPVVPRRFEGVPLDVPGELAVPGHTPIRVELYYATSTTSGVQLTCAGTIVADRLADLTALGLDVAPWTEPELAGSIEFASFSIPPGTRRGVLPDAAAAAFVEVLAQLAPHVSRALESHRRQRDTTSERQLLVELRRALRGLRERLPYVELPSGTGGRGDRRGAGAAEGDAPREVGDPLPAPTGDAADAMPVGEPPSPEPWTDDALPPTLLPPGPVASVRIVPATRELWPGGARRVRAIATDVHGQTIAADTTWLASSSDVTFDGDGAQRTVRVGELCDAARFTITVMAQANGGSASCTIDVEIIEGPPAGGPGTGIPEPVLLDEPAQRWRSRMASTAWQVNVGHADYRALAPEPRARLRYLVALFAKDLTVTSTHQGNEPVLEQMIDILAHAERNLVRASRSKRDA